MKYVFALFLGSLLLSSCSNNEAILDESSTEIESEVVQRSCDDKIATFKYLGDDCEDLCGNIVPRIYLEVKPGVSFLHVWNKSCKVNVYVNDAAETSVCLDPTHGLYIKNPATGECQFLVI